MFQTTAQLIVIVCGTILLLQAFGVIPGVDPSRARMLKISSFVTIAATLVSMAIRFSNI